MLLIVHNWLYYDMHKCKQAYKHICTHYTQIYILTRAKCSFSQAHQRANKHTDEPLQAQNPFITSCCGEDTEMACHVLHSLCINPKSLVPHPMKGKCNL